MKQKHLHKYNLVVVSFKHIRVSLQAKNSQLIKHALLLEPHEKETSSLGLRFQIETRHFSSGRLKIRCTASIGNLYWQSTEKSIEEEKPKPSPLPTQTPIYSNDIYEKDYRDTNRRWDNNAFLPGTWPSYFVMHL